MWGRLLRAATSAVGGYFIALIVERMLGVLLTLYNNAPGSGSSVFPTAISTVQSNFLLLVGIGIVATYLAGAHVEAQLVGR